jgi:hypothetical protein
VFHIVAAHDDELALAVEIVGVDHAKARLAGSVRLADAARPRAGHLAQHQREQEQESQDDRESDRPFDQRRQIQPEQRLQAEISTP